MPSRDSDLHKNIFFVRLINVRRIGSTTLTKDFFFRKMVLGLI